MKPKRLLFKPVLFFITLVTILVLPAMAVYNTDGHWDIMTIEKESPSPGGTGLYTSIAIDKNNVPHTSWVNEARSQVEYGTYDTKTDVWTIERVGPIDPKLVTQTTSIDIDPQGNPAISYQGIDGHLYFAHRENGIWNIKDIYATGGSTWSSLKYAPNGQPYIALADGTWKKYQLTLAWQKNDGSGWDVRTIDNSFTDNCQGVQPCIPFNHGGYEPSLAFDSQNRATIAYRIGDQTNEDHQREYLRIARQKDDGAWEILWPAFWDCPDNSECGIRPSLVVDSHGDAHYYDGWSHAYISNWMDHPNQGGNSILVTDWNRLQYAVLKRQNTSLSIDYDVWNVSPDIAPVNNWDFSMTIDSTDTIHSAYVDPEHQDLVYLQWITKGSSQKRSGETHIDHGNVGRFNAIAADSAGNPWIVYRDDTNNAVRVARWVPEPVVTGSWKITTVATGSGGPTSTAVDPSGRPCISYYNETEKSLKFMRRDSSGSWNTETVAGDGQGQYSSLVLNQYGYPVVSYYDAKNHAVKYARWTGTNTWSISTVESNVILGDDGGPTSLVLDSLSGLARIAYYDTKSQHLHYEAENYDGSWRLDQVDGEKIGPHPSLALHTNNVPVIGYLSEDTGITKLKYVDYTLGAWVTKDYDWPVADGPISLVMNTNKIQGDRAEIAYTRPSAVDSHAQNLTYIEIDRAENYFWIYPIDEWVKPKNPSQQINTLSLRNDRPGHSSLAYFYVSPSGTGLKYAHMRWGNWKIDPVVTNAGEYPSLALDPSGNAFISYFDRQNNTVNLAEWVKN
jgi:hypothetical protein